MEVRYGSAGHEPEGIDGAGDIVVRHCLWLAGVGRLDCLERLPVLLDDVRNEVQDIRAFLRGGRGTPGLLGHDGGGNSDVDIIGRAGLHRGDDGSVVGSTTSMVWPEEPGTKEPLMKCPAGGRGRLSEWSAEERRTVNCSVWVVVMMILFQMRQVR